MIERFNDNHVQQIIADLPIALLCWYPFKRGADIIVINEREDNICTWFKERTGSLVRLLDINEDIEGDADYIVCIGSIERYADPIRVLKLFRDHIKSGGTLLLGMNNRLGIRYFCGDRDPYTDRNFDGIEDYWRAYHQAEDKFKGRMYDRHQIESMLDESGFLRRKTYSVYSDLENAAFLFADGYIPAEDPGIRIFPTYNYPDTVFLEEERIYRGMVDNGLFHTMANAFLIECTDDGELSDALQVTSSLERGRENAMITVIHDDHTVTKQAAFPEGYHRIQELADNMDKLRERGVPVVDGKLEDDDVYRMPYIEAETGQIYLERLLKTDLSLFLEKLDEFRDLIMRSSDSYMGVYEQPVPKDETEEQRMKRLNRRVEPWEREQTLLMREAFIDMIPLNSFHINDRFVFFDQEYCKRDYPVNVILDRMIMNVYLGTPQQQKIISAQDIYGRYGLPDHIHGEGANRWSILAFQWLRDIRKEKELAVYHKLVRKDWDVVNANRQKINFSEEDYRRLFIDIFENADTRKLVLFGSGVFARRFLALYGEDYPVTAVIDNNDKRWGQKLYPEGYEPETQGTVNERDDRGVMISSPDILKVYHTGEFKVLICIKNYLSVMKQLELMDIKDFAIFDPSKDYQRKRHPIPVPIEGAKKYHVGYIAGVFDLYHIGHLNMFRRAKEQCDYLIVGIVSDEGVRRHKKTDPFVPYEERAQMVASCRYVDEVVEIPYMYGSTEDAWRMHHFDVQFSGSDYENDPSWLASKAFLEKHGATLKFFPYTQSTSSTKLKALIEQKLL